MTTKPTEAQTAPHAGAPDDPLPSMIFEAIANYGAAREVGQTAEVTGRAYRNLVEAIEKVVARRIRSRELALQIRYKLTECRKLLAMARQSCEEGFPTRAADEIASAGIHLDTAIDHCRDAIGGGL